MKRAHTPAHLYYSPQVQQTNSKPSPKQYSSALKYSLISSAFSSPEKVPCLPPVQRIDPHRANSYNRIYEFNKKRDPLTNECAPAKSYIGNENTPRCCGKLFHLGSDHIIPWGIVMQKRKDDLTCQDRFYIFLMTITFGLAVPFLVLTAVKLALGNDSFYMYGEMKPEEVWPVKEYAPPPLKMSDLANYTPPVFMSNLSTANQVVEFYAPWCPHCQHFKLHYIDIARNCTAMAKHYGVEIEFQAVSCTANPTVCKHDEIYSYPTIKLYQAGNGTGVKISPWQLHCFTILRVFGVDLPDDLKPLSDVSKPMPLNMNGPGTLNKIIHDGRTKKQIFDDALLSFDFAMRHSIFMSSGPLSNRTAETFQQWIELLTSTLPPAWNIHAVLDVLDNNMDEVTSNETKLISILDEHGPSSKKWSSGCPGGYTCGLWELFHIMSVGVVEWNKMSFVDASIFTAEAVADTLHDYISEFFACDLCRKHFVQDYADCKHDRCNRLGNSLTDEKEWMQFPLWLWETHNDVRVRLMHEKAARESRIASKEDEIAVQWPSRDDCPICWHDDGSWDDEIIYKYIRLTYWIEDSVSASFRKDLNIYHQQQQQHMLPNDDDVDKRRLSLFPMVSVPIIILSTFLISIACKKAEIIRTGRHKKIDFL